MTFADFFAKRSNWRDGWGGKCAYCRRRFGKGLRATRDHIFPRVLGGEFSNANIAAACRDCNEEKGAMTVDGYWHWLVAQGRKTQFHWRLMIMVNTRPERR